MAFVVADKRAATFLGLSTDTKPTADVAVGARLFEFDTGNGYIFDGTVWHGPY